MNYMEALKCYLNALRIDKDNIQILRDTALLQVRATILRPAKYRALGCMVFL
jgi:peptide alpha-N-acetyltransferase